MELTINGWIIVLFIAVAQGLFLLILLFSNRSSSPGKSLWIIGIVAVFVLTLVDYLGYWTDAHLIFPHFASSYFWLNFLIGPLFYGYINNQKKDQSNRFFYQFIPAGLIWLMQSPFFFSATDSKIQIINLQIPYPNIFGLSSTHWFALLNILILLHLGFYIYLSISSYQRQKANPSTIEDKFRKTLIFLFSGYFTSYFLYVAMVSSPFYRLVLDYCIALMMAISIYTLAFLSYRKPQIVESKHLGAAIRPAKYKNSALTPNAAQSLKHRLESFMETDQPFYDNELRLAKLAKTLSVHPHHLSQVINEHFNQSFSSFINSYRIEKAKELLSDDQFQIIEIAYQTGFNNKTSFYKAFRENTGLTPSEFRKRQRQSSQK